MCEKLEFNEKYKAFTEVLHREVQTFEQCEEDVVQALAIVADDLKLGKVKYELELRYLRSVRTGSIGLENYLIIRRGHMEKQSIRYLYCRMAEQ